MTAVRRLQLVGIEDERPKGPPAPGVVRVAIATRDMKGLNAHFGSAPRFAVYDVTKHGWDFVEAVAFADASDEFGLAQKRGRGPHRPQGRRARGMSSDVLPGDRRAVGRQGRRRAHPSDQGGCRPRRSRKCSSAPARCSPARRRRGCARFSQRRSLSAAKPDFEED